MILFHGCGMREVGHYWWAPGMISSGAFRRRHNDRLEDDPYRYVPWGFSVDGGLAPQGDRLHVEGQGAFAQSGRFIGTLEEEWWSAISWWDNSIDKRPASNATFVIDQRVSAAELLVATEAKFSEVLGRMKYDIEFFPALGKS